MKEFQILGLVEACACCLTRREVVSCRRSLAALGALPNLDLLLVVVFLPDDSTPNSGCSSPLKAFILRDCRVMLDLLLERWHFLGVRFMPRFVLVFML